MSWPSSRASSKWVIIGLWRSSSTDIACSSLPSLSSPTAFQRGARQYPNACSVPGDALGRDGAANRSTGGSDGAARILRDQLTAEPPHLADEQVEVFPAGAMVHQGHAQASPIADGDVG